MVAIVGYGNQGHAHALNLRDSGARVIVGARPGGEAWKWAAKDGFDPGPIMDVAARADCIAVLLPDEVQERVCADEILPVLKPGAALVFAHGFSIAFGVVKPPKNHDVLLVAPKGRGISSGNRIKTAAVSLASSALRTTRPGTRGKRRFLTRKCSVVSARAR